MICCLTEFLMSRRLAVRRWLTSLSCRCFVSMDLLKTIVVLSSTTIVVFIGVLVLFGCFETEFIFDFSGGMFKKTSEEVSHEHQRG